MSPLLLRLITMLIAIPLVTGFLWAGKEFEAEWAVLGLLALVTAVGATEYVQLVRKLGVALNNWLFSALAVLVVIGTGLWGIDNLSLVLMIAQILLVVVNLALQGSPQKIIWSFFGLFYLAGLLSLMYAVYLSPSGFAYLVLLLGVVWAYDSGAFITGSLWGKTKLAPAISPKKSWEGVAGGLLLAIIASSLSTLWIDWQLPVDRLVLHVIALSLLIGGFAQIGDLFESRLKREAGLKDTGTLFPGHGGLLDRIDGLLFATPIFYFYLKIALHWI